MGGEARYQTAHASMLALTAYPLSDEMNSVDAVKKPGIKTQRPHTTRRMQGRAHQ